MRGEGQKKKKTGKERDKDEHKAMLTLKLGWACCRFAAGDSWGCAGGKGCQQEAGALVHCLCRAWAEH